MYFKNENTNDDLINGDDLASSFAAHRDSIASESQLLNKEAAEARLFFNTSATGLNATSLALTAGAISFIMLNSIFVLLFLTPTASNKKADTTDNEQDYEYYYDENTKKRRKR